MREYLSLLRRRPGYRRLWAAQLVSQTGDWLGLVAVSVVVGQESDTGGVLALAWVLAAHLIPHALLSPFAGVAADRYDRRAILLWGNILEGVVTLAMVIAAWRGWVVALSAMVLLRSALAAARDPAGGAALPRLVEASEIEPANALGASTWSATFVVGMALGGLVAELGAELALAVDAASFALAALLLLGVPKLPPEVSGASARGVFGEMREALARLSRADVRAAVLGKTPPALASGLGWIALNVLALEAPFASGAATTLGVLQAMRGFGTGVGPLVAVSLIRRGAIRRETMAWLGMAAEVGGALAMALTREPAIALGASLAWGCGAGTLWVITATEIVERSEDRVRGRLLAIDAIGYALAMSAGGLVTALAIEAGLGWVMAVATIGVITVLGWAAVRRTQAPRPVLHAA